MGREVRDKRRESEDKQIVYKSIVKRANEFKQFYCERMGQLLQRLEEHEETRIQACKAAADKIIVYEASQEMNNKYDAKVFGRVAETIDGEKQLRLFKSKVSLLKIEDMPDFQCVKIAVLGEEVFGVAPQNKRVEEVVQEEGNDGVEEGEDGGRESNSIVIQGRLSNLSISKLTDPVDRKLSDDLESLLSDAVSSTS